MLGLTWVALQVSDAVLGTGEAVREAVNHAAHSAQHSTQKVCGVTWCYVEHLTHAVVCRLCWMPRRAPRTLRIVWAKRSPKWVTMLPMPLLAHARRCASLTCEITRSRN